MGVVEHDDEVCIEYELVSNGGREVVRAAATLFISARSFRVARFVFGW